MAAITPIARAALEARARQLVLHTDNTNFSGTTANRDHMIRSTLRHASNANTLGHTLAIARTSGLETSFHLVIAQLPAATGLTPHAISALIAGTAPRP